MRWFHTPDHGTGLPLLGDGSGGLPVLAGEAHLIVEGEERPLKQWDFVHCPPETRHVFVGAGDGPCVLLAASSRQFQKDGPWGYYCADEIARRHGACPDVETQDTAVAYANVPPS